MNFESEIRSAINKYSAESESNTPDFILATYLINCLNAFNVAVKRRESWYKEDGQSIDIEEARDVE